LRLESAPPYCGVTPADEPTPAAPKTRAPRHGWLVITLILVAMALLAVYSNVQRARRGQVETVTIAPPPPKASPTPSPAAAP
jgi:hypothetical protein